MRRLLPSFSFGACLRLTALVGLLLAGAAGASAQPGPLAPYGNEWIQPGQPYYKLKVGQRGIHRLTAAWLTAAGVPVATLDPRRLQLWRRGREQAIYVAGEADGRFDATDYVDFWGQLNDGRLDAEMYRDPAHQISHLAPVYADTAAYFLTIAPAATPVRRMAVRTPAATGLTPVRHHQARLTAPLNEFYMVGPYYDNANTALPWFDKSEGLIGRIFGIPSIPSATYSLTLPIAPDTTHLNPRLDVMVASEGPSPQPVTISLMRGSGTTATVIRTLGPYPLTAYQHRLISIPVRYADFNPGGVLSYRVTVLNPPSPPNTNDALTAVAYTRIYAAAANALGSQSREVWTDSTLTAPSQYLLFDTPPPSPLAYDITDPTTPVRISGQMVGAQWGVVVATPAQPAHLVIAADAAPRVPGPGRLVAFRPLAPQPGAFLLVTGRRLLVDSLGRRPIREYATYRASAAGGGYDTLTVTIEQLHDLFHYGDASPNAIRRFASFMNSGSAPAGYLFLVGKGYEPWPKAGNNGTVAQNRIRYADSHVPAFGYPGSDVVYTADFQNGNYVPRIATGRLAATTPAEVTAYLEKVRAHEIEPPAEWRMEVLHLGGGKSVSEQQQFRGYLADYARRVEDSAYFGGHATSILRGNTGQSVTAVNVSAQVNRGLAMITFFGHSSTSVSDIDIGRPSDALSNYRNVGRYPFLLMNGCSSGNVFLPKANNETTFGEDWVLTPRYGAIGFLAYAGMGIATYLNIYSTQFYRAAFNTPDIYGRGLGEIQQRAIREAAPSLLRYQEIGMAQLTEMVLQTDPAVRIYSPALPDYVIADSTVYLRPLPGERLTARTAALQVVARVRNYGKALPDSVRVQVRRTYPGGSQPQIVNRIFAPVLFGDTLVIDVPNPGFATGATQGLNTFEVLIDWPDSVREFNETNNRALIRYAFPSGSVFPLFPQEFALVPNQRPSLVGEYDQPLAQNRDYTFELDTVAAFTSAVRVQQRVTAGRYPTWQPTLPATAGQDSVVWYWRFRPLVILAGEDSTWATSSFRHVAGSPGGWSQSHHGQFSRDQTRRLSQAVPSGRWSYSPTLLRLLLRTASGDSAIYPTAVSTAGRTFMVPPHGITFNQSSRMRAIAQTAISNMFLMVFNPRTLEPVTNYDLFNGKPLADPTSVYGQDDGTANQTYVMFQAGGDTVQRVNSQLYALTALRGTAPNQRRYVTARADSMAAIINRIPDGFIVALVTVNRVPFDEMRATRPALLTAIRSLGSRLIDSLHSGDPLVLLGQKGALPGTANERSYNRNLPRWGQQVILDTVQSTYEPQGLITSTVIGPVQEWHDVVQTVKRESPTSSYSLKVIPIDTAGRDGAPVMVPVPANPVNSTSSFRLTGLIDPVRFPRARLEMFSSDTLNRRAPQLEQWVVTYNGVPEGIVRTDRVPRWAQNLSSQVDSGYVRLKTPFQNISTVAFRDSVTVEFSLTLSNRTPVPGVPVKRVKMAALLPDSLGWATAQFVIGPLATGDYLVRAVVNPGRVQPEQYDFNNTLEAPFKVVNPNLAPLIDVAFDGQHILHGDIVAPAPLIAISVRDEDKNIPLDPDKVTLVLTRPGQAAQQIPVTGNAQIRIQTATATRPLLLTYEPGRLPDGTYRLQVQATDPADNRAGADYYDSEFRVINETMISNFYPYPNPFSTNTRFLFTITGKVPQNLKIQIMTVTGRVVREIMKEELGTDLRIGHNTSTTSWNGTDEYGDLLANGVYLYRVVVQDEEDVFKSFKTAGDNKAFHKTWGKLYILR